LVKTHNYSLIYSHVFVENLLNFVKKIPEGYHNINKNTFNEDFPNQKVE